MSAQHRRAWRTLRTGPAHPSSGYQATIAKVHSAPLFAALWYIAEWLWWGLDLPTRGEPRYRVLVGRPGSNSLVGVREAHTLKRAVLEFDLVDQVLAEKSPEIVREEFGLEK